MSQAGGLKKLVGDKLEDIDAREVNSLRMFADARAATVVVRVGRYGPVPASGRRGRRGEAQRANLPDDLPPDELDLELAEELFSTPQEGRSLGTDPVSGHEIVAKEGRFGPYVTGRPMPEGAKEKPRTGSLFKSMTLGDGHARRRAEAADAAARGRHGPGDGVEITAQNGRYGPYLKKGTDSRSLDSEEQLFTVTLEEALKIFAQPKQRGAGRREAAAARSSAPTRSSGKPMVVKDGRFGPYVTDGETNASLRKGDAVETLTDERAAELLAEKRAKGPVKKKAGQEGAAKKAAAKKAPAKTKS